MGGTKQWPVVVAVAAALMIGIISYAYMRNPLMTISALLAIVFLAVFILVCIAVLTGVTWLRPDGPKIKDDRYILNKPAWIQITWSCVRIMLLFFVFTHASFVFEIIGGDVSKAEKDYAVAEFQETVKGIASEHIPQQAFLLGYIERNLQKGSTWFYNEFYTLWYNSVMMNELAEYIGYRADLYEADKQGVDLDYTKEFSWPTEAHPYNHLILIGVSEIDAILDGGGTGADGIVAAGFGQRFTSSVFMLIGLVNTRMLFILIWLGLPKGALLNIAGHALTRRKKGWAWVL